MYYKSRKRVYFYDDDYGLRVMIIKIYWQSWYWDKSNDYADNDDAANVDDDDKESRIVMMLSMMMMKMMMVILRQEQWWWWQC